MMSELVALLRTLTAFNGCRPPPPPALVSVIVDVAIGDGWTLAAEEDEEETDDEDGLERKRMGCMADKMALVCATEGG